MNSDYDIDDYDLTRVQDTFADFDLDEEEDDMYAFDNNDKRDQLEYEMSVLESFIVQAAVDGADPDTIERLEDELELLTLDYHKLGT
jgi:hypothetical protein